MSPMKCQMKSDKIHKRNELCELYCKRIISKNYVSYIVNELYQKNVEISEKLKFMRFLPNVKLREKIKMLYG